MDIESLMKESIKELLNEQKPYNEKILYADNIVKLLNIIRARSERLYVLKYLDTNKYIDDVVNFDILYGVMKALYFENLMAEGLSFMLKYVQPLNMNEVARLLHKMDSPHIKITAITHIISQQKLLKGINVINILQCFRYKPDMKFCAGKDIEFHKKILFDALQPYFTKEKDRVELQKRISKGNGLPKTQMIKFY